MEKQTHTETTLFSEKRYAAVPFPLSQKELAETADVFMRFLMLPREVKRQLHFSVEKERGSADGYTEKLDVPDKDRKEFFHWRPELMAQEAYTLVCKEHKAARDFFSMAETLYRHTSKVAHETFATHFPAYVDRLFDHVDDDPMPKSAVLRFLSYEPEDMHLFCAKAHFDKGFCTFALAESAPGLRVGSANADDLYPVKHKDHTALCMPGMMFHEATNGDVKPVWHDVVHHKDEPRVNDFCARWAIVYFIELPDLTFSSWESVHTPLD